VSSGPLDIFHRAYRALRAAGGHARIQRPLIPFRHSLQQHRSSCVRGGASFAHRRFARGRQDSIHSRPSSHPQFDQDSFGKDSGAKHAARYRRYVGKPVPSDEKAHLVSRFARSTRSTIPPASLRRNEIRRVNTLFFHGLICTAGVSGASRVSQIVLDTTTLEIKRQRHLVVSSIIVMPRYVLEYICSRVPHLKPR